LKIIFGRELSPDHLANRGLTEALLEVKEIVTLSCAALRICSLMILEAQDHPGVDQNPYFPFGADKAEMMILTNSASSLQALAHPVRQLLIGTQHSGVDQSPGLRLLQSSRAAFPKGLLRPDSLPDSLRKSPLYEPGFHCRKMIKKLTFRYL